MKPEPPPKVKGKGVKVPPHWEDRPNSYERFDNAVRRILTVSKDDVLKAEAKVKTQRARKRAKRNAIA